MLRPNMTVYALLKYETQLCPLTSVDLPTFLSHFPVAHSRRLLLRKGCDVMLSSLRFGAVASATKKKEAYTTS